MKVDFSRWSLDAASRFAQREALVNVERGRRYTHLELHRLTNRIAHMVKQRLYLAAGDIYLTILENDNMSLLSFAALAKTDVKASWCNFRDTYDEHLWQIDLVEPKVVFLENALLDTYQPMLSERGIRIICMDPLATPRDGVECFWDLLEGLPESEPHIEIDMDEPLLYRFTGGTTGKGKCCMYSLRNWLALHRYFYAMPDEMFGPDTRHLSITPLSHGSSAYVMTLAFKGGCHVTMNAADLRQFCANIQNEKITTSHLVPTILYRFLEFDLCEQFDLSSLQAVIYSAAPMSPAKLTLLQEKFGNIFIQAYGSSEALAPVAVLSKADHLCAPGESNPRLKSAGIPLPETEIVVMDDEGRELPCGQTGELWIRGPGVIQGYYKNPEQTAAEFQDGYWKSGDLGFIDENRYVHIVDRKKDMIISGGFNVYAIEVEAVLNAHPAVLMSAAIGIPHDEWGESVHAEIVLKDGHSAAPEKILAFCKERIGYKAPKSLSIVESLPVTVIGKVLRRAVRDKYWSGQQRRVN
ncbi:class I adenylate-forming enzyme family protein [Pseudomonas japonica]|uniref:Acyl-CoA synthetase (AMP-forming)/AMP-acid ligase II n=1 Tax=Pseudomonas japonica TaxID=256466 RepID=A0A239AAE2_9PSED|nr:class I adenylate-forming enzyme family protein [Pseudomonas japonica]SNR92038.1 Acyl-CoA synthetase (AMP-forming)/AMP-acid ligase II [Pseudomonas japonica]